MHPKPKLIMFCAMYTFCVHLKVINTVLNKKQNYLEETKKDTI